MVKHTQAIRRQFADELYECVWPSCEIGAQRVKNITRHYLEKINTLLSCKNNPKIRQKWLMLELYFSDDTIKQQSCIVGVCKFYLAFNSNREQVQWYLFFNMHVLISYIERVYTLEILYRNKFFFPRWSVLTVFVF